MRTTFTQTSKITKAPALMASAVLVVGLGACAPTPSANEIVVWTKNAGNDQVVAQQALIDKYEAQNPGTTVRLIRAPARGDADATALITAVRGGTGPDVFLADRFTIAQFASLGLLQSVQPQVDAEPAGFTDDYLDFALDEASLNGDLYGLPFDTDTRGLFYNKQLLRDAGVDPEVFNPENGPPTIDEVWEIADKITMTDESGNYTQMGFLPWGEQGWPFTYGLANNAQLFDQETCTISVDDPGFRKIYTDFDEWGKKLNYAKADTFQATYQPPNSPPSQTPFFNGKLGMSIVYSNFIFNIETYAPDLDWGVTYLPVNAEGDEPRSWSGGSAFTIPTGARNVDGAWDFMKFMAGEEGQRDWAISQKYLPTYAPLLDDPEVVGEQQFFADMLENDQSVSRTPLPVGSELWETMNTARDAVLLGDSTPDEVMDNIERRVQPQLEPYCPVTLGRPD